jgi:integrase
MVNIKIDIHKNKLDIKINALPKWKVPDTTKKEIFEYVEKGKIGQVVEGKRLTERTLSKHLSLLKHLLEIINKPTNKLTKEDIETIDKELTKENLASVANYRLVLKGFLRWRLGEERANKLSGWLDVKTKKKTPDYLSEQEILKLYKNCKNPSERFLIAVLFDTGARAEEFLNIRYEDIQIPDKNDTYVKIALKEEYSKTKGRTISLYWKHSLEAIKDFIKERQEEGIKSSDAVFNKTYDSVRMFLFRLGRRVLNKEVYPHLFRHSSATFYATKLNRQELCYRYGWAFSSDMPDVYISRAGMESKQLDEKFKSTELEDLQRQFEKEKFETERQFDEMKKDFETRGEEMQKILLDAVKDIKVYDAFLDRIISGNPQINKFVKKLIKSGKLEKVSEEGGWKDEWKDKFIAEQSENQKKGDGKMKWKIPQIRI